MTENAAGAAQPDSWKVYYEKTGNRPPRKTLLHALDRFEAEGRAPGQAVDLGCGSGRDTIEILRRGWPVLAVDAEPDAIEALTRRPDLPAGAAVDGRVARFEDVEIPSADLINSSFALPLCPKDRFLELWPRLIAALRPGGRLSCQLYGDRDTWAGKPDMTFVTRDEAEALLAPLEIEMFAEEEDDSVTPRGVAKHWHIFHIVGRKPA